MSIQDLKSNNMRKDRKDILPLDMDDLPEFFQQKAVRELNYSPDRAAKAMIELKKRIATDDILKNLRTSENLLNIYLMCRKLNVDRAFKQLRDGIIFCRKHPETYIIPSHDELSAFMTEGVITLLPRRCQDGCVVLYINLSKWKAEMHTFEAIKKVYNYMICQCLRKPMTQVNGFKLIIDLDATWEAMKNFTPQNLHLFAYGTFVLYAGRFKAVHFLNMYKVGRMLWQMAKGFFSAKLRDRIKVHKTRDTLLDFFDREDLPCSLGGNLKDCDMKWWMKKYLSPEEKSAYELEMFSIELKVK